MLIIFPSRLSSITFLGSCRILVAAQTLSTFAVIFKISAVAPVHSSYCKMERWNYDVIMQRVSLIGKDLHYLNIIPIQACTQGQSTIPIPFPREAFGRQKRQVSLPAEWSPLPNWKRKFSCPEFPFLSVPLLESGNFPFSSYKYWIKYWKSYVLACPYISRYSRNYRSNGETIILFIGNLALFGATWFI